MKHMIFAFLMTFTSLAQASHVTDLFAQSELVKSTIKSVVKRHQVVCKEGSVTKFFKRLNYVTYCAKPNNVFRVKIAATFKDKNNPVFSLKKIKVKVIEGIGVGSVGRLSSEEMSSTDPFLEAFKKSGMVLSLRHFIEDEYKVVCKKGSARKGIIGGKANYFYFVTCKSDTTRVRLKLKSKVHIFGEDVFKFGLVKYKLTF